jgi:hypothetical protein
MSTNEAGAAESVPIPGILITGERLPEHRALIEQTLGGAGLTLTDVPDVRGLNLDQGEPEETESIDLSTMAPEDYVRELDRLDRLIKKEISRGQTPTEKADIGAQSEHSPRETLLLLGLESLLATHPDHARSFFDALSVHKNHFLRDTANTMVIPLLAHEVATDDPHPEGIIEAWVELAKDEHDTVSYEAQLMVSELLHDSYRDLASKLTVYQLRELLRIDGIL